MRIRNVEDGYQADFATGRTEVDGDGMFYLDASVDGQGGTIRDKPVFTKDEAAFYLNRGDGIITYQGVKYESGAYWNGAAGVTSERWYGGAQSFTNPGGAPLTTLTFGFYETTADILPIYSIFENEDGTTRLTGFSTFDADQRTAARQAIEAWDELIAIDFVEKAPGQADINFMNTTTGPIQASAFLPYDYGAAFNGIQGDVAVNPDQASNHLFDEGQYGLTTLIHELGHSLGLEHPGNYNFGPDFSATYDNGAEYYQDSNQYSIMSYWDAYETGAAVVDWNNLTYRYASTPGVHDILAIQRIYGADYTTRNGNDTYGFNMKLSTTGLNDDSYNFVKTPAPVMTIWDGGGNDTLDLSGYNTPSVIDLNPGAFSSAGGVENFLTLEQINANRAKEGLAPRTQATLDVYNELFRDAFGITDGLLKDNISIAYGVTIENAVGGGGNDKITGNSADNSLTGNNGDDEINGGSGNDKLFGNNGIDKLFGDAGNDRLEGANGEDVLNGGAGNDILIGGRGKDFYVFDAAGTDTISGYEKGEKIDLSAFGVTAAAVTISKGMLTVELGANDLTILGVSGVTAADLILG